jgi:hypothetical protein
MVNGVGAIGLEDPHCPGGTDAMAVQEDHDFAHGLLFGASISSGSQMTLPSSNRIHIELLASR